MSHAQLVSLFVRGLLDVQVPLGQRIGAAAAEGAPNNSRQVGFRGLTNAFEPMDPSHVYDVMHDLVQDGQSAVDAFQGLAPKRRHVVDPVLPVADVVQANPHAPVLHARAAHSAASGRYGPSHPPLQGCRHG